MSAPWMREGATVYALNEHGTNAWWARVQSTGRVARGEASPGECEQIARLMVVAPEMHDALRDAAQLLIDCAARMPPGTERLMARIGAVLGKAVAP